MFMQQGLTGVTMNAIKHTELAVSSPVGVTHVVFRKCKCSGEVIAVFPRMVNDFSGRHCGSYTIFGRHKPVMYRTVLAKTQPATPEEYAHLAAKLAGIGYTLEIITRTPARLHKDRMQDAMDELFG